MSGVGQAINQSFPPKPTWTAKDVPDLADKVVLITGGNTGIGKETARVCLEHNAKVYIACRSEEKAQKAIEELKDATGGKIALFLKLDLGDLKSVKAAAEAFTANETHLNILFNNAGVMACPVELLTSDGHDLQFGTNALGHYYFTTLLLPVLLATAKSNPSGHVRVVNTSSSAILRAGKNQVINWESLAKDEKAMKLRKKLGPHGLYSQSKCANVLFANELARRYGEQGIVSSSLNPGNIKTELQRYITGITGYLLDKMLYDISYGALTQLYAGTAPEAEKLNGKYFIPWARVGPSRPELEDPALAEKLWSWCEEQVKDI